LNLDRFLSDRSSAWSELDALVRASHGKPTSLPAADVRRLGALYRGAAADLALARRRFPGDPATVALEHRVGLARQLVYHAPSRRESLLAFVTHGYWAAVRARSAALLIAAVVLFGTAGVAAVWADRDPGRAGTLVPSAYHAVTQPRPHGADLGLPSSERAALSGEIFTNNIRVTLLAFAGGIVAGIGTILLLLYNGLQFGVVAGLAVGSGNGRVFFELVTAHGVLELSCIVVAAAAGMRMGWAAVEPGRRTRTAAVGNEAREAVKIVLGTAPWLVVAGLIEGFVTPAGLGLPVVLAVGFGVAALYWSLVFGLGRRDARRVPAPSP
jgi:uncharacterized membrane protein SpoIIM required for sporulation